MLATCRLWFTVARHLTIHTSTTHGQDSSRSTVHAALRVVRRHLAGHRRQKARRLRVIIARACYRLGSRCSKGSSRVREIAMVTASAAAIGSGLGTATTSAQPRTTLKSFFRALRRNDEAEHLGSPTVVRRERRIRRSGPNGAGKSTCPRAAGGSSSRARERSSPYGRVSTLLTLGAASRWRLSGRDNIDLGQRPRYRPREWRLAPVDHRVRRHRPVLDAPVKTYRGRKARSGSRSRHPASTPTTSLDEAWYPTKRSAPGARRASARLGKEKAIVLGHDR